MGNVSSYDLAPAKVYTATVVEVNPESYTMRVYSKQEGTSMPIEVPSVFTNSRDGAGGGAHFMPEVGAEVWVCRTSDGTVVPLQYHGAIGDASYANGRPKSLPGDIVFSTNHGNSIQILKGGSNLIQASPVCSTVYDSLSDSIRTFSNSYYRYSLSSTEEHYCDNEITRNTNTDYAYFYNAEDEKPVVVSSIGSDNSATYTVTGYNRDASFAETWFTKVYANGNCEVFTADLHVDVDLCTIGDRGSADFVVNSTQFLSDLNAILLELAKVVGFTETMLSVVGPLVPPPAGPIVEGTPQFAALVPDLAPLTTMLNQIAASAYPTNKLKSE